MARRPIAIFDSGVGGLSVLRRIHETLPEEDLLFFADQAHVPYGPRPLKEVQLFSRGITRFLKEQGAKLIVLACNTASAAALHELRTEHPSFPFVGMEPAVKPAAIRTRSLVVGVLATPATFQGRLFTSVVERFAEGVRVVPQTLPGLVERIEEGDVGGETTMEILRRGILPLLEQGADTLVLACTHYSYVIPAIEMIAGPEVQVVDPTPAIARQTERLLDEYELASPVDHTGSLTFFTSGDPARLGELSEKLSGLKVKPHRVRWVGDEIEVVEE